MVAFLQIFLNMFSSMFAIFKPLFVFCYTFKENALLFYRKTGNILISDVARAVPDGRVAHPEGKMKKKMKKKYE